MNLGELSNLKAKEKQASSDHSPKKEPDFGTLILEIIEAKLTRDTETFGKMDPFAEVYYDISKSKFKTKTINDGGKNVKWNETFKIPLKSDSDGTLKLGVYDEDVGSADLVGEVSLTMSSLFSSFESQPSRRTLTLLYKDKKAGELTIDVKHEPPVEEPELADGE